MTSTIMKVKENISARINFFCTYRKVNMLMTIIIPYS